ncbi:hypothetical protein [Aneurinibacillus terranovensis]|uniref:hypothetical protein n=1 Tax=Aneurinibacillus terranovensis TaxID=278991 RepID=UPI00040F5989|nr:hypothetical protein [Aneurinibacillus terranovensis]
MCDEKGKGDDNMLVSPTKAKNLKRKVTRGYRSNLLAKATPEQLRVANEMAKKSRGISNLTYRDVYGED